MLDGGRQLAPGDMFAGYRIEGLAGRGGMGLVYQASQVRPARTVAVKVIAPELANDPGFRMRFEREASLAAQIEHPNVIPVYGVGEEDGLLFIVMRYVPSRDLGQHLAKCERFAPADAVSLVRQIAGALDAAHARGLVHRDVKPANVLVAGATPDEHLYLTDFGLSKLVAGPTITATGQFVGTVDYMAPEQILGRKVGAPGDVYALGCVLYHLLTGDVPFPREDEVAKIYAHLELAPPAPSEAVAAVPPALDAVVARAMAKEPAQRFASAGALAQAAAAAAATTAAAVQSRPPAADEVPVSRSVGRERSAPAPEPPGGKAPRRGRRRAPAPAPRPRGRNRRAPGRARSESHGLPSTPGPLASAPAGVLTPPGERPLPEGALELSHELGLSDPPVIDLTTERTEIIARDERVRPAAPTHVDPVRPTSAPSRQRVRDHRPRRWTIVGAVVVIAAACAAGIVAISGSGGGRPPAARLATVRSGPLALDYRAPWRVTPAGAPGSFALASAATPIRLGSGQASLSAGALAEAATVPGGPPPQLERRYGSPYAAATTRIVAGVVRRYTWRLAPTLTLVALIVPTDRDDLAILCGAPSAPTTALASCDQLASTMKVSGVDVVAPGPDPALAASLSGVLRPLATARRARAGLAAKSLPARAPAAARIARAGTAAHAGLAGLKSRTRDRPAIAALARDVGTEAAAFVALAAAARADATGPYARARTRIVAAGRLLDAAVAAIKRQGYAVPALGSITPARAPTPPPKPVAPITPVQPPTTTHFSNPSPPGVVVAQPLN